MTPAQLSYVDSIVLPRDPKAREAFVRQSEVMQLVDQFERRLIAQWNAFVQRYYGVARVSTAPVQADPQPSGKRFDFKDFGAGGQAGGHGAPQLPTPSHSEKVRTEASNEKPVEPPKSLGDAQDEPVRTPPQAAPGANAPVGHAAVANPTNSPPPPPKKEAPAVPSPMSQPRFQVNNARQGEVYVGQIQVEPRIDGLRLVDLRLPDESGLTVDKERWQINGTPEISGEFSLGLRFALKDDPEGASRTGKLPLVINADPKTLWKDLPSDRSAPFWKEDEATAVCFGNDARLVAARKRGRSHAHKGTCCDDDFLISCEGTTGWHVAIVADGKGSGKFSRRGSQVATREAGAHLSKFFAADEGAQLVAAIHDWAGIDPGSADEGTVKNAQQTLFNGLYKSVGHAAYHAARAILAEAANRKDIIESAGDLATTFIVGIARKVKGKWFCAAYWVGDGAVAVYRRGKEAILLGKPDSGEYSGETRFLDQSSVSPEEMLKRIRYAIVDDLTGFVLMSDGVSDPKFPTEAKLGELEAWDRFWADLDEEVKFSDGSEGAEGRLLRWLDFWAVGEYDDRTIAIIG